MATCVLLGRVVQTLHVVCLCQLIIAFWRQQEQQRQEKKGEENTVCTK